MKRLSRRHSSLSLLASAMLIAAVALSLSVGGCEGATSGDTSGTTIATTPSSAPVSDTESSAAQQPQLAMAEVSRLAPAAKVADVRSAASSMSAFGADLYKLLAAEAVQDNLVFSPSSIVTALAMTYAGAGGTTAQEMADTLHFALQGEALHNALNSLDAELESRNWTEKTAEGEERGVILKSADSLWADKATHLEQPFLETLAADYGAGVRLVDFQKAAETARQAINKWVAAETNDKIPELLPKGTVGSDTCLVLADAVYLHATWKEQFLPQATKDGEFHNLAAQVVTVPMMTRQTWFPYAKGERWQAVELPYAGDQLAMLLIVPDEGRFPEVESMLSGGLIDHVVSELATGKEQYDGVLLTLPKFEFRVKSDLAGPLKALGMKSAFDPNTADFSNMSTVDPLFVDGVAHEAFISVDEEGTEAAAATAVTMAASGSTLEPKIVKLKIDRPFLFAIRDRQTGALLFLGRVSDPAVP